MLSKFLDKNHGQSRIWKGCGDHGHSQEHRGNRIRSHVLGQDCCMNHEPDEKPDLNPTVCSCQPAKAGYLWILFCQPTRPFGCFHDDEIHYASLSGKKVVKIAVKNEPKTNITIANAVMFETKMVLKFRNRIGVVVPIHFWMAVSVQIEFIAVVNPASLVNFRQTPSLTTRSTAKNLAER